MTELSLSVRWRRCERGRMITLVTDAAKKLLEQFDALSEDDQRWLVDALLDRVGDADDDELSDEWNAELSDRIGDIERGEVELVDADSIADELRERYG